MTSRKPILVTGSHRSGSTWVGRMISASPSVGYIHEPFNPTFIPSACGAKFVYWYTYITDENESTYYYKHIKDTIEFRYNINTIIKNIIGGLKVVRSREHAKRVLRAYKSFSTYRSRKATPLVKDPIAFFSAEWLYKRFDMNVLVLIRHPAAFASSLKRLNWVCPFSSLLQQPLLMRDYLYSFEAQIKEYSNEEHDVIDEAILFWRIIHQVIIEYQSNHEDWIFLRHEDISRDPLHHFQNLFKRFDLDFSQHVRTVIQENTDPSNPSEAPESAADFTKRDSKSSIWNWKNRLTESEIERIREQVEDISKEFYSDSDW